MTADYNQAVSSEKRDVDIKISSKGKFPIL